MSASTTPHRVTFPVEVCAEAAPTKARAARAIRFFFTVVVSKKTLKTGDPALGTRLLAIPCRQAERPNAPERIRHQTPKSKCGLARRACHSAPATYHFTPARKPFAGGVAADKESSRSEERRVGKECRSRWSP